LRAVRLQLYICDQQSKDEIAAQPVAKDNAVLALPADARGDGEMLLSDGAGVDRRLPPAARPLLLKPRPKLL
jgi:hypothetical protein